MILRSTLSANGLSDVLLRRAALVLFVASFGLLMLTAEGQSQNIGNYSTSTNATASLTDMSSGTTDLLPTGVYRDSDASSLADIGFDFWFMGVQYTQFSVNSNGQMRLGSTVIGGTSQSPAASVPLIVPISGDNAILASGKAHYKVTGSAPNRILIVEWLDLRINYGSTGTGSLCQALLYESTGVIEFKYGTMYNNSASAQTRSVNISSSNIATTVGWWGTITGTPTYNNSSTITATSFSATSNMTNLHGASDGSRRIFSHTPPVPSAPTSLSFTSVAMMGMTLNWTDNSANELGFVIYKSTDNSTFTFVTQTAANATSQAVSGLNSGTTYYWNVYAVTEGALSTALSGSQSTTSGSLSGTKTVGPTGNYATLTAAISDINTNGLSGSIILELQAAYTSTSETFPIAFPFLDANSSKTITIRPETGATGRLIESSTSPTINLNGAVYVIFDGRPGGSGSSKELTISNTSASGVAVQLINDACNNTVQYCILKGVNNTSTGGVVLFSTTTGSTGNDGNTIDNCEIRDGTSTPTNCIYASGTAGKENSGNTISNSSIYNFYASTMNAQGINISTGNTAWTISGNSLFQTSSRAAVAYTTSAILISNSTGANFSITGNSIGGSAAGATGAAWTTTGSAAIRFVGISLSVALSPASSIQNNTITNFGWVSSSGATTLPGIWCGIYHSGSGRANIGTITGNTIGNGATTGAINSQTSTTAGVTFGIGSGSSGITTISNNTIGSITTTGSTSGISHSIAGIQVTSGTNTISGNTIGSTVIANSLHASTASTSTTSQYVTGILSSSSTSATISNNTISNLTNAYVHTGTSGQVRGIAVSSGTNSITGNTISILTNASTQTGSGSSSPVIGISYSATTTPATVSQNVIHTLQSTAASSNANVLGMYYSGPTSGTNLVSRNFIHSLDCASSSASALVAGLQVSGGMTNYQNNMIRVGIKPDGTSLTTNPIMYGIYDVTGTNNYYFNSVYVGGSGVVSSSSNTYAFYSGVTVTTREHKNNIFVNNRANASGTAVHYAIRIAGTSGLTCNYNVFHATGGSGQFGANGASNYATFADWKSGTGLDANSAYGDPQFIDPTNNAASVNLHIHPTNSTPIEGSGTNVASITDDYDGQTRSGLTPEDIGADAGNFTGADLTPPTISYTLLTNTASTSNRSFTPVTITDPSGVNITAGTRPRCYFKRSSDANAYNDNTSGTDGWKWVEANGAGSSPFDFTINYALLNGGSGVVAGHTVQYFVVAQDLASTPNIGINSGGFTTPPTSVALLSTNFPITGTINSYNIVTSFSGSYDVGTGAATYTTLKSAFDAINGAVVTGDVTLNVIGDCSETATAVLNQFTEEPSGSNFTITIQPSGGAARTISGDLATSIIKLNGADRVTIDGLNSGSNSLTIQNNNVGTSSAVIWLASATASDGATNNTIKRCTINGNATTTTLMAIFSGGTSSISITSYSLTANSSNTIESNTIAKAQYGILLLGMSTSTLDASNQILTNAMGSAVAGDGFGKKGLWLFYQNGATVSGNNVQNIISSSASDLHGIFLQDTKSSTVSKNKVHYMSYSGSSTYKVYGITTSTSTFNTSGNPSANTYVNNVVYDLSSSATSASWNTSGINNNGGYNDKYYYNSVYLTGAMSGGTATGGSACFSNGNGITSTNCSVVDVRDNIFYMNGSSSGAAGLYAHYTTLTSYTGSTISNNCLRSSVTGSGIAYTGRFNATNYSTLATWQAATSQDANSIESDPMFNSSTNLQPQTGSPVLNAGTPIGGVTTDIEGNIRNGSTPTIGAYENAIDTAPPTISYTLLTNTSSTSNRSFTGVTITDPSGVNITAGTRPRCYFKRSTDANTYNDNTSGTDGWKWVEANGAGSSPFDFTINYALLNGGSGVVAGNTVQYFVVAQDLISPPNVGINSGTFATSPSSVALVTANFPIGGTINSYNIATAFSGNYDVGTGAALYTTLKAFFDDINSGVLTGNVTANLVGDCSETATAVLNQYAEDPMGSNYTLKIQPSGGAARTISGAITGAVIKLNGADRVTIDGLNTGGNSLTIQNTSTSASTVAIWLSSLGAAQGATNNTIKNTTIRCGVTQNTSTNTTYAILSNGSTISTSSDGADNDDNTIMNNTILQARYGIYVRGINANLNENLSITQNTVGPTSFGTDEIGKSGIVLQYQNNATVSENTVRYVGGDYANTTSGTDRAGIALGGDGWTPTTTTVTNTSVTKNYIHHVIDERTYSAVGIIVGGTGASPSANTIANNSIFEVRANGTSGDQGIGIGIAAGDGDRVVYNSIYLQGDIDPPSSSTATQSSAGIRIASTTPTNLTLKDNAIHMDVTSNTATLMHYAIVAPATTYAWGTGAENNNDYYVNGGNAQMKLGGIGTTVPYTDVATLASWQTQFTPNQDANSIAGDPLFNGTSDLHPMPGSPLVGAGAVISGITTDIIGDTRGACSPTCPTIGAYENSLDSQGPTISYTLLGNTTSTGNRSFTGVTITDASGVNITSGTRPRCYFKRSGDANTFNDNTSGTDGWKWVEANGAGSSPFDFTINYSLLNGGSGVSAGTTVQYFVVAQDLASTPNVSINSGTFNSTPASVALTASHFPLTGTINSYQISYSVSGTYTVGSGGTYTTLKAFFDYINANVVTGDVLGDVIGDCSETATAQLNAVNYEPIGNVYTITIKAESAPAARLISGDLSGGLVVLNGADHVRFDGTSSSKFLTFRNINTGGQTFLFTNDAKTDTITYCNIEGAVTTSTKGVIHFSTTTGASGNDENVIRYSHIRDRSDATGVPAHLIYSSGTAGALNSQIKIINNDLYNYSSSGVNITSTGNGDEWTVSDNNIYQTLMTAPTTALTAIICSTGTSGSGHAFNNNSIGGFDASRTGNPMTSTSTVSGIVLNVGTASATNVQGNTISNIYPQTSAGISYGMNISAGNVNVGTTTGNTIGGGATASDTIRAAYDYDCIRVSSTGTVNVANNTISHASYYYASADQLIGINLTSTGTYTLTNNSIHDLKSNTTSTTYILAGIKCSAAATLSVTENKIYTLRNINLNTAQYNAYGIHVSSAASGSVIKKNRVYDISGDATNGSTTSPVVHGMYLSGGNLTVSNNQISLGTGIGNDVRFRGIEEASAGTNNYYYNSVFLTGTTATTATNASYAFLRSNISSTVTLNNNIFFNARENGTGATGSHFALGLTSVTGWYSTTSNYNMYATIDTNKVGEWGTGSPNTFLQWKASTSGDANSWYFSTTELNPANLFSSTSTGNLLLQAGNVESWYVNGKGIANSINTDYEGTSRWTVVSDGTTDIGSDEMTPSVDPPVFTATPSLGGTTKFTFGGRQLSTINWGGGGTVPTSIDFKYYPGATPPGTPVGDYGYVYWTITATGGTGFTYNITFNYDPATIGTITPESDIRLGKYDGSWVFLSGSTVNTTDKTISATGLTSFSSFALTDASSPLPVELISFNAKLHRGVVQLDWKTATEVNNYGFFIERRIGTGGAWQELGFVAGSGTSNTMHRYSFMDDKLPAASMVYYRLRQVDRDGQISYSAIAQVMLQKISGFTVLQNYPNPFGGTSSAGNASTSIVFTIPKDEFVTVKVYDMNGKEIQTLVRETMSAGLHARTFFADGLPAGIYRYLIVAGSEMKSGTMTLLK